MHSRWYDSAPNVPTWNYAVVHAYGHAKLIDNAEATRGIAYRLVAHGTPRPDMEPIPAEYEARLLAAVVTFEIRVDRLEGKYKLSQNKSAADRENVRRKLSATGSDSDRQLADLMHEEPS